ncbi:MAG: beta-propeller domain-containing protein [Polyangiales bacterium]
MTKRFVRAATSLFLLAACTDDAPKDGLGNLEQGEFVSAEGQAGEQREGAGRSAASDNASQSEGSKAGGRTVEEGDIYRVLESGQLLNLNPYRGLQVVDLHDVAKPTITGRLREAGTPVEMYVVGKRAIVLLNNWTGYYGARSDVAVKQATGGLVLNVDLSNPAQPVVVDRELVPGYIQTSRLAREGDRAALYVAAQLQGCWGAADRDCRGTVVKSFDASGADLLERSRIDLGGYVNAVQATPEAMIVASYDYDNSISAHTSVSLIDIANVDGHMTRGPSVSLPGIVRNKFNLDLHEGVLRVVSTDQWGGGGNRLNTFDARVPGQLRPVAECAFGAGQQLFATLFLDDRAFFVTYLRQDPFHSFSLDAAGGCKEESEFIVSGWNDFFKPAFDERRLIGIGTDDAGGSRKVAVSLYDITDLHNANPLVAREVVESKNSYSTASWDDKAYSVIEGGVSIPSAKDPSVLETGLVLLPFVSYDDSYQSAKAGVQIYTFSERTLTRRGVMLHGTMADRSFQPTANLTANLSDTELSLFDTTSADAPVERGRVELAPSYTAVHEYGAHLVRIRDTRNSYRGWWTSSTPPSAYAEVIGAQGDPDTAPTLASIAMPAGSRTFKVGSLLVIVTTESKCSSDTDCKNHSILTVHDLTDPLAPKQVSSLTTDRLLPGYGYGWGDGFRGMTCGVMSPYSYDDYSRVLPNTLVFGRNEPQQKPIGKFETCNYYLNDYGSCESGKTCSYVVGDKYCQRKVGTEDFTCSGGFHRCTQSAEGETSCVEIPESGLAVNESCNTYEQHRYWASLELDVLDLTTPSAPKLTAVSFAKDEEVVGLVGTSDSVYFAFQKPVTLNDDTRPHVKHYFRQIDLRTPSQPAVSNAVNVPGELLAVEGEQLILRDLRWGAKQADTWLHSARRVDDKVSVSASKQLADRDVKNVLLDGAGHLLVSHARIHAYYESTQEPDKLSLFAPTDLAPLGEVNIDSWATMTTAAKGRVLFAVPGGFLVINAQNAQAPYAQAFFPQQGYLEKTTFQGDTLFLASGPFGLRAFDATASNLLTP